MTAMTTEGLGTRVPIRSPLSPNAQIAAGYCSLLWNTVWVTLVMRMLWVQLLSPAPIKSISYTSSAHQSPASASVLLLIRASSAPMNAPRCGGALCR